MIPTVDGRDEFLHRAVMAHLPPHFPHLPGLMVERGWPTCGDGWNAGVAKALDAEADYVLLTADDLLPREDWWEPALAATGQGYLPAARTYTEDGVEQNTEFGPAVFPRVPFLPAQLAEALFPIPPLHYYSDVWIGEAAGLAGWECRYTDGFEFTHLWAQPGRHFDEHADKALFDEEIEVLRRAYRVPR